ncbi:ABC transporter permease subunit [Leptolyngbya sp. FACHB-261]|uniref:ABC transporter permease n=1 Tax=Leptolyngbya sp. FACHB-261 TaxID=2692806 RepID=UPI0016854F7B|nr:ABC transporter permease subunit [Leptolyngbya sp. FACHB-261]MBD2104042.1 ABC transporter permease [Leptolyngbya sp. FACHB-261]
MLRYTLQRLVQLIPVLIGLSIVVFLLIHLIPGDPAQVILGQQASETTIENFREQYGLNRPLLVQYFDYVGSLLQGDLGTSLRTRTAISREILPYLSATAELTSVAMIIAVVVGINIGILAAWKQNSVADYASTVGALIGVSMPVFWLGLLEQWLFAQTLGWLPSSGRTNPRYPVESITGFYLIDTLVQGQFWQFGDVVAHLVLPGIALGTIPMAIIARMTRSSMLEVLKLDYVRTARAKGLPPFKVIYLHALKNAFIPVWTVIGLQFGFLLGGAVLTETVFGWPGVGRYIYDAISFRDFPVIQSGVLVLAIIFVVVNLLVDLFYAFIDPRIRYR